MKKCTATLAHDKEPAGKVQSSVELLLLIFAAGDLVAAILIGYCALFVHHSPSWQSIYLSYLSLVTCILLILSQVVTSLAFRKADVENERRTQPARRFTKTLAPLGRATCAVVLLLTISSGKDDIADLAVISISWLCFSPLILLANDPCIIPKGGGEEAIAVIGARYSLTRLAMQFAQERCVARIIDHSAVARQVLAEALANVLRRARDGAIGLVVLAPDEDQPIHTLDHIPDCLRGAPFRTALCGSRPPQIFGSPDDFSLAGASMTMLSGRPLSRRDMLVKLIVDKIGALLLIILAAPLLIAIALAILLESEGPVIFKQNRNGWCGRLFIVFKFRTMRDTPGQPIPYQTLRGDPRCTRLGKFLRSTSLDELPQLWNVLRGDMSLVGPRPHADFMHAKERMSCGPVVDYVQRQRVKPGLTGWAQVHGLRGAVDTPEKLRQRVEFDRYYIDNWSIWLDFRILARTPWAILSRENAF